MSFDYPVGDVVEGWGPRTWPEPVTLEGGYVRVVPLSSAQYSDLFVATCGPGAEQLWTYRPIEMPTSLPGLWMHLAELVDDPAVVPLAFVPSTGPRQGKASGVAGYCAINPAHGTIELGGVLHGAGLRRTPASTEAVSLLMRYALEELGYRRFEWKCDALNEPSRRAAARLGFTYEGRFRNHMVTKGRNRDTDWYSVTAEEWAGVRKAHERWLDPANFDGDGRQRISLADLY